MLKLHLNTRESEVKTTIRLRGEKAGRKDFCRKPKKELTNTNRVKNIEFGTLEKNFHSISQHFHFEILKEL